MVPLIAIGITAFLLSYLGVWVLRHWAQNGQTLDIPNARSSHTQPTPRGGGLLIVIITLIGLTLFELSESTFLVGGLWAYVAGGILIAIMGWLDDLRSLPFWLRISSHGLAALLIILFVGYLKEIAFPVIGELSLGWLGIPLTFVLIVGSINAYNFMDGIDGLAGLQATLGGLAWMIIGLTILANTTSLQGILLGASAFGFLIHNWSPARIFMGDVGSTFLGFTFAEIIVLNGDINPRLPVLGILILWPFIFDTSFTLIRRIRLGENIVEAHRSHLYQRLVISGFSHSFVSILYGGLSVVGILLGISWCFGLPGSAMALALTIPLLASGLVGFVFVAERRTLKVKPE